MLIYATFIIISMDVKGVIMKKNGLLLKNTVILTIGMVLPKIFTVLTIPIYSAYLKSSEFGNVDYITTLILSLVVPIITLQLENGVFRYLIEAKTKEDQTRYISSAFFVITFFSLITMVIMYFIPISGINTPLNHLIISIYIGIETYILFFRNVIRGLGKNTIYALSSIVSVVANFILMVITMMVFELGILGMLLSLLFADVFSLLFILMSANVFQYIKISGFNRDYLGKLLRYSLPLIPNTISWFIINISDRTIIMWILGSAASGIYATAYKIPNIFNMFYSAFNLAWTETASRNANEAGMSHYYSRMFGQLFKILSAGALGLLAFSKIAFDILVRGAEYADAINYMPLLIVSTYLSCIASFYGSIYIACKESKKAGISSMLAAVVNLVVHFALINFIGLNAAVVSTFVSFLVITLYRAYDINKYHYKLRYNKRVIGLVCVLMFIEIVLYYQTSYIAMIVNMLIAVYMSYFLNEKMIKQILIKIFHH